MTYVGSNQLNPTIMNKKYNVLSYEALVELFMQGAKDLSEGLGNKANVNENQLTITKLELMYSEIVERGIERQDPQYGGFGIACF